MFATGRSPISEKQQAALGKLLLNQPVYREKYATGQAKTAAQIAGVLRRLQIGVDSKAAQGARREVFKSLGLNRSPKKDAPRGTRRVSGVGPVAFGGGLWAMERLIGDDLISGKKAAQYCSGVRNVERKTVLANRAPWRGTPDQIYALKKLKAAHAKYMLAHPSKKSPEQLEARRKRAAELRQLTRDAWKIPGFTPPSLRPRKTPSATDDSLDPFY